MFAATFKFSQFTLLEGSNCLLHCGCIGLQHFNASVVETLQTSRSHSACDDYVGLERQQLFVRVSDASDVFAGVRYCRDTGDFAVF